MSKVDVFGSLHELFQFVGADVFYRSADGDPDLVEAFNQFCWNVDLVGAEQL